jgi:hypothetical protein
MHHLFERYVPTGGTPRRQDSGTFNDAVGSSNESDCKPCAARHYRATPASEEGCGAGTFCEDGSVLPIGVSVGNYSVDAGGNPTLNMAVAESVCPAGFYCPGGSKAECTTLGTYYLERPTEPVACPAGSYCRTPAEKIDCDAGQQCAESGTEEPRPCAAGHYCATPASEVACEAGTLCEEGSELPTGVSVGYYSVDAANEMVATMAVAELSCPSGFYCSGGAKTECTTLGAHCPEQSTEPLACPAGSHCRTPAEKIDCEAGQYEAANTGTARNQPPKSHDHVQRGTIARHRRAKRNVTVELFLRREACFQQVFAWATTR